MRILDNLVNKIKAKRTKGSYGKSIVLLASDPAEIERLCERLGDEYVTVMELMPMDNNDYGKVIIRKEQDNGKHTAGG